MTKYWVNTNQPVITKAFMTFAHNNFSKYKGCDGYETYAEIDDKSRLAYVYEVSNHYQSSWTGRNEMTHENMCDYEELDRVVRFYVGLVVPKLKKEHVAVVSKLVITAMTTQHHKNKCDWYNTYGFDSKAIEFSRLIDIVVAYLKEHSMYREKTEYVQKSTHTV